MDSARLKAGSARLLEPASFTPVLASVLHPLRSSVHLSSRSLYLVCLDTRPLFRAPAQRVRNPFVLSEFGSFLPVTDAHFLEQLGSATNLEDSFISILSCPSNRSPGYQYIVQSTVPPTTSSESSELSTLSTQPVALHRFDTDVQYSSRRTCAATFKMSVTDWFGNLQLAYKYM